MAQRPMAGCGDTASLAGRGRAGQARRCPEPSSISVSVLRTALQVTEASDGLGPEGKTLKFMVQDRYPVSHRSCGDISRPFPALTDVSTCRLAPWCPGPQGTAPTQPCCPCSVPWDLCRQQGQLRAVQPSSQGAFLSRIPSFPGRLQLGLVLPAHKVAEDTPAPSVADISYFPLSAFPSLQPSSPFVLRLGGEGGKEGWDVSIPSAEPGKVPPPPAGARKVSLQLLLLVPVWERVTS